MSTRVERGNGSRKDPAVEDTWISREGEPSEMDIQDRGSFTLSLRCGPGCRAPVQVSDVQKLREGRKPWTSQLRQKELV